MEWILWNSIPTILVLGTVWYLEHKDWKRRSKIYEAILTDLNKLK